MRWSYKTVHFGLKKDGLLGGAFLDDTEIEATLNEYGQSGWELVSMFETRDGVIAVFKQPLDMKYTRESIAQPVEQKRQAVIAPKIVPAQSKPKYEREPEPEEEELEVEEKYPVMNRYLKAKARRDADEEPEDSGIGSIRIE